MREFNKSPLLVERQVNHNVFPPENKKHNYDIFVAVCVYVYVFQCIDVFFLGSFPKGLPMKKPPAGFPARGFLTSNVARND